MEAVLLLPQAGQGAGDRQLAENIADIAGDEPGLAVLIGADTDGVPLELMGHQDGVGAHVVGIEGTA